MAERVAAGWVVGRGDPTIYVEQSEPLVISGMVCGEACFDTEVEALEYAIMCEVDAIKPMQRNLRSLKARLRRARQSVATILKEQEREG